MKRHEGGGLRRLISPYQRTALRLAGTQANWRGGGVGDGGVMCGVSGVEG